MYRAKVGFQHVALVVCRDLPLEQRFYPWLLFAPAKGKKWEAYVRQLLIENNQEYLHYAEQLRPKEFNMLKVTFEELMEMGRKEGLITPEMEAQLEQEQLEGTEIYFKHLLKKHPQVVVEAVRRLKPEERQQLLKALLEQEDNT